MASGTYRRFVLPSLRKDPYSATGISDASRPDSVGRILEQIAALRGEPLDLAAIMRQRQESEDAARQGDREAMRAAGAYGLGPGAMRAASTAVRDEGKTDEMEANRRQSLARNQVEGYIRFANAKPSAEAFELAGISEGEAESRRNLGVAGRRQRTADQLRDRLGRGSVGSSRLLGSEGQLIETSARPLTDEERKRLADKIEKLLGM